MKKYLILSEKYLQEHEKQAQKAIKDLNTLLDNKVKFEIIGNKLNILAFEKNIKHKKVGRPQGYTFDFEKVKQMKARGMTNKQIYEELEISKALFYFRMREYKKN